MRPDDFPPGTVWLVGAGPGDPELLAMKAVRLIESADVVFYDALVGSGVLDLIPARTERVNVRVREVDGEDAALIAELEAEVVR